MPRLGPLRSALQTHSPEDLTGAGAALLEKLGLPVDKFRSITPPPDAWLAWLNASPQHALLPFTDPLYPPLLAELDDAPTLLWVQGDVSLLSQPQLAIVGSRSATAGGLDNAREFAGHLAQYGLTITSGLAEGVDAAAHAAALNAGGSSIAVTGTGLDRVYPARNRELAHRLAEHGALISEFPPGTPPRRAHFPQRNRLIAGMSLGVLVVEASVRSGSLITARLANEQGREVLAIPGSIHNPLARGCHYLIQQGAKLVETGDDVISELSAVAGRLREALQQRLASHTDSPEQAPILPDEHTEVIQAIGFDPVTMDQLCERLELTVEQLSPILLALELDGRVRQDERGRLCRADKRL